MYPDIDRQQQQRIADQLRRLSGDFQQPYGWEEFQRRSREQSDALRQGRRWGFAAAAASLLIIVSGIAALSRASRVPALVDARPSPVVDNKASAAIASADPAVASAAPAVASAASDSRATGSQVRAAGEPKAGGADSHVKSAEHWLASLPPEPIIVKFGTRAAVTGLEDRIAQLDDLMTAANARHVQPARLSALQQERGRLVDSLVQVRYAEALAAE